MIGLLVMDVPASRSRQVAPPSVEYSYPVTALPPSLAFATKATEIVASPAETTTLPGESGLVRGVPETDEEAVPAP